MRISVVIPAYNAESTLIETLDSVAAQTRPADEIVVVNDGSSDQTSSRAKQHKLRPLVVEAPHAGAAAALNLGVRISSGEIITFLDADDLWSPIKLACQEAFLASHPTVDAAIGHFSSFVCGSVSPTEAKRFIVPPVQAGWLSGTLMIRRQAFDLVGAFTEDLRNGFVIDWFDRAKSAGIRMHIMEEVLLERRIHPDSLSARSASSDTSMLEMARRAIARRRSGV